MYQDGRAWPPRPRDGFSYGAVGFTLVEVVIAIAVISFVLISILGLMGYASRMVQQSDNTAKLSMVLQQTLSTLGSQPYSFTMQELPTNIYYTAEGLPTNSSGAYYLCAVTNVTPTGFALKDAGGNALMEPVQITIRWPINGTVRGPNSNTIVTSILNYD